MTRTMICTRTSSQIDAFKAYENFKPVVDPTTSIQTPIASIQSSQQVSYGRVSRRASQAELLLTYSINGKTSVKNTNCKPSGKASKPNPSPKAKSRSKKASGITRGVSKEKSSAEKSNQHDGNMPKKARHIKVFQSRKAQLTSSAATPTKAVDDLNIVALQPSFVLKQPPSLTIKSSDEKLYTAVLDAIPELSQSASFMGAITAVAKGQASMNGGSCAYECLLYGTAEARDADSAARREDKVQLLRIVAGSELLFKLLADEEWAELQQTLLQHLPGGTVTYIRGQALGGGSDTMFASPQELNLVAHALPVPLRVHILVEAGAKQQAESVGALGSDRCVVMLNSRRQHMSPIYLSPASFETGSIGEIVSAAAHSLYKVGSLLSLAEGSSFAGIDGGLPMAGCMPGRCGALSNSHRVCAPIDILRLDGMRDLYNMMKNTASQIENSYSD
jgi:hypothetical protein